MVKNVTENWSALQHWTKEELMKRYPDMVVGMGNSKELGQGGGLRRTTISDYILNWMHSTSKYVFHTLGMPEVENFLADCTHLPMPTRMYYEDREAVTQSSIPEDKMWKDHLAIAIGHDSQGLTSIVTMLLGILLYSVQRGGFCTMQKGLQILQDSSR